MSRSAREGLERAAERSPRVAWPELRRFLEDDWKPGQHISVFGPNGYGKSTVLVELCEITPQPAVLFVTKRRDSLIRDLPRRGWTLTRTLDQTRTALRPPPSERYFGAREQPPARIVYWPQAIGSIRQRRARLHAAGERFLDWVYEHGRLTVAIDEGLYAVEDLHLGDQLRTIWHESRSSGVSLLIASQRPSWLPKSAYSAPTYLIMFSTNDPDDLRRLADVGGAIDPRPLRDELRLLPMREFLFVAPRAAPAWSVQSRVEAGRR